MRENGAWLIPGWVDKGQGQRTRWNPNPLDGLRAIPAPDFAILGVIERLDPFGEGLRNWQAHLGEDKLREFVLDHLQWRAKVFLASFANQAAARSREELKINSALPEMFHSCGKEVRVIREQLVLCCNPYTTVANWNSVAGRHTLFPR